MSFVLHLQKQVMCLSQQLAFTGFRPLLATLGNSPLSHTEHILMQTLLGWIALLPNAESSFPGERPTPAEELA